MVLVKMLMEIDPLPMRGSLVMTLVMISPLPEGSVLDWFRLVAAELHPISLPMIFSRVKVMI